MVKMHINNSEHITVVKLNIPPGDTTSETPRQRHHVRDTTSETPRQRHHVRDTTSETPRQRHHVQTLENIRKTTTYNNIHCLGHIKNTLESVLTRVSPHRTVLTGDINDHSTLLHSYTDDQENKPWQTSSATQTAKHKHLQECHTPHYNKRLPTTSRSLSS